MTPLTIIVIAVVVIAILLFIYGYEFLGDFCEAVAECLANISLSD